MTRDIAGMFFIVGLPILMGVLFGLIGVSMSGDGGSAPLQLALVDEDDSDVSARFAERLVQAGNVDLVTDLTRDEAMQHVRRGQLVGFVAVPKGFSDTAGMFWMDGPAIAVGVDPSRQAEAGMIEGLIMQAMGELIFSRFTDPAVMRPILDQSRDDLLNDTSMPAEVRDLLSRFMGDVDAFMGALDAIESDNEDTDARAPGMQLVELERIDITASTTGNETLDQLVSRPGASAWDLSFPSAMLWGALACSAGFAITLVRERTQGTLLRLQMAPITRTQILAGKGLACMIAVVSVCMFMTILGFALGLRPGSVPLLVLAMVCIAFCFVGVMMLMSVLGRTEEAVGGAAWGINIVLAMFGGGMVPLLFMPGFMRTLSNFSPVKWGIIALEGAIWRGFTVAEMLPSLLVLVGVGTAGLAIGVAVFTRSLARA